MLKITMRPGSGEAIFGRLLKLLSKPFDGEVGRGVGSDLQASVRKEFEQSGHSKPGGGVEKWDEVKAFGTRPAPSSPLGGVSGSIARAWLDGAPRVTSHLVEISSDHPAGFFHRGGDDGTIREFEYDVTDKATVYIRRTFGVPIPFGSTFTLPSRPHATTNPGLEEAVAKRFAAAVLASV